MTQNNNTQNPRNNQSQNNLKLILLIGIAVAAVLIGAYALFATSNDGSDYDPDTYVATDDAAIKALLAEVSEEEASIINEIITPLTPEEGFLFPEVNLDSDQPVVEIPENFVSPTSTQRKILKAGTGIKVNLMTEIAANYVGYLSDGTKFGSSYDEDQGPMTLKLPQSTILGWTKGLQGVKVGSTVLLVIPASEALGDQENGEIPANSTLIFVMNITSATPFTYADMQAESQQQQAAAGDGTGSTGEYDQEELMRQLEEQGIDPSQLQ
jgi:hypothetical protein